jgi:hypothetical protein
VLLFAVVFPVLSVTAGAWSLYLAVPIVIAAASSMTFLALTISVYRYWKPKRLIPAYLRYETRPRFPTQEALTASRPNDQRQNRWVVAPKGSPLACA